MILYLVLTKRSEEVGTRMEETPEYAEYSKKLWEYEKWQQEDDLDWFSGPSVPPEPKEKYHTVPVYHDIPRIIEISVENPIEKYNDRILSSKNPYGDVFIEEIEIDGNTILNHYAMTWTGGKSYKPAVITNYENVKEKDLKKSFDSASL